MSQFVDECQLNVRGGDGGAGCVSFRREGPVVNGGPNGGDGGKGGDVWLVADHNVASLLAFRDHPHRRAGNGVHGKGKDLHGRGGTDEIVDRARRDRGHRPLHGRAARRAVAPRRPLARRRRRPRRAGQRQVPLQQAAGPDVRRAGRARRGALAQARAAADGRRRPRRLPERRQEHADQRHLGGQAEDRRLPVHHARAQPRRRRASTTPPSSSSPTSPASSRGPARARASATSSCATSSGPGCCASWSTWPVARRRHRRPSRSGCCSTSSASYRPELLDPTPARRGNQGRRGRSGRARLRRRRRDPVRDLGGHRRRPAAARRRDGGGGARGPHGRARA